MFQMIVVLTMVMVSFAGDLGSSVFGDDTFGRGFGPWSGHWLLSPSHSPQNNPVSPFQCTFSVYFIFLCILSFHSASFLSILPLYT